MTPKKYYQIIVGITLSLVVVGGVGYWYAVNMLMAASQNLATQMGIESSADLLITNLQATKLLYDREISPILPQINNALPTGSNQTQILAQLQQVAKSSGAALSAVSFPPGVSTAGGASGGGIVALPISFQVSGSFSQLQNFLAGVENLSRLTTVNSLTVSRSGQTITYAITINAYSKP